MNKEINIISDIYFVAHSQFDEESIIVRQQLHMERQGNYMKSDLLEKLYYYFYEGRERISCKKVSEIEKGLVHRIYLCTLIGTSK